MTITATATQVSEERVADAERLNKATVDSINKLRRGRSDFLHQMARLTERVSVMSADMKHFAQAPTTLVTYHSSYLPL